MEITKVFGTPGTGKTTTLISMLGKELENGISISDVAYLTHTRAGAEEVKRRIGELFSDQMKKDLLWFRTIHSACCKVQGITARETIGQHHRDMFQERYGYSLDGGSALDASHSDLSWDVALDVVSYASATMREVEDVRRERAKDYRYQPERFYRFLSDWDEFKQSVGMLDFVDQLDKYDGAPLPVKVMFVDEAQDLSALQWKIIWEMAADCERVYVAGDDDQAIFDFIGADEYGFLDLKADYETILTHSYRVPQAIGQFAEKIISRNMKRKEKAVEWSDHEGTIKRIASLDSLEWRGDITTFVLARHNKQVKGVSKYLSGRGVPHSVNGKSVQRSPIANIAKTYLELLGGEEVAPSRVTKLAKQVGLPELATEMRKLTKLRRPEVGRADCKGVNFSPKDWTTYLAHGKWRDLSDLRSLQAMMNTAGTMEIIGKEPPVAVMTYHYSKGREADRVVCLTDCYSAPWDALHTNPASEIRLCYVGVTRTKKELFIVWPEAEQRMLPLL
jgi:superfamily I DNA/RNA helicase